jgi:outer membrane protein
MVWVRRGALLGAACSLALGAAARGETLGDAIGLADQTNPTLQAQRAEQRALDESYVQALTGFRPNVSATASVTHDDNTAPFVGQSNSSSAVLSVTQPIYTGGRVATAVSAAEADILAGREALRRTEISVLLGVVQAYVDVRRDQQRLAIAQENVNVLRRQLEESKARFDVGELTRTDVAQTEARLAAAQSALASSQAQLAISRTNYNAVVGQNPGDLAPEPPLTELLPQTVDAAFDTAEGSAPILRQADYTEQASAARVAQAKAQTRPTVSARASLGYNGGSVSGSPFIDYSRDVSASAVVNVPIFTGGLTQSQIRAAAERNNSDRIGIEGARRQVIQQVSQSWNQLLGARANVISNQEQVRAAGIAYEGTRQEAQVGLRTTLDVLNQEQELRNAELALVNARHDEYLAGASVLAAIGTLSAKPLSPTTPIYDPKTNFDQRRHAFGWVPWEPIVHGVDQLGAPEIIHRPPPGTK